MKETDRYGDVTLPQVSLFNDELCDKCVSTRVTSDSSNPWVGYWKEKVGIIPGDTKDDVCRKLRDFREDSPTCIRCGGDEYTAFCSMRIVSKQSEEVIEDVGRDDHRNRVDEVDEPKTIRTELSSERKRNAVRQP